MDARPRILVLALAFSVSAPALTHAQQSHSATVPVAGGPRLEVTATAVRQRTQLTDSVTTASLAQRRQNVGRPIALMIVGGAAIILGAVIGGDAGTLFMIGGAVTGLIGLYQYLQ